MRSLKRFIRPTGLLLGMVLLVLAGVTVGYKAGQFSMEVHRLRFDIFFFWNLKSLIDAKQADKVNSYIDMYLYSASRAYERCEGRWYYPFVPTPDYNRAKFERILESVKQIPPPVELPRTDLGAMKETDDIN